MRRKDPPPPIRANVEVFHVEHSQPGWPTLPWGVPGLVGRVFHVKHESSRTYAAVFHVEHRVKRGGTGGAFAHGAETTTAWGPGR